MTLKFVFIIATSVCATWASPVAPADEDVSTLLATFQVSSETFHAVIANPTGIDQALMLWSGRSDASVPAGLLVAKPVSWNQPWSWHLDPASIVFGEVTIEACDALPSFVEQNLGTFGNRYCPWPAVLVGLQGADGVAIDKPNQEGSEPGTAGLFLTCIALLLMQRRKRSLAHLGHHVDVGIDDFGDVVTHGTAQDGGDLRGVEGVIPRQPLR